MSKVEFEIIKKWERGLFSTEYIEKCANSGLYSVSFTEYVYNNII